ncbi:MAG: hypothetical protein N2109_04060 [Fimbriimonadales bacterium]|nr:hypothetical protein [Fimbriimonadales bacterium]
MRRRGAALASVLSAGAIVLVLLIGYLLWPKAGGAPAARPDGLGQTTLGAAKMAARDAECRSNLGQVRQALRLAAAANDEPPASLEELRLPQQMLRCPIGAEPYVYQPADQTVRCAHPGHEGF